MRKSLKKLTTVLAMAAMFLITGSVFPHAAGDMVATRMLSSSVWIQQQDVWYCLDSYGQLQTGWLNENGNWYYLNSDGAMQTGWLNESGNWYYLNSGGAMQTGWLNESGNWYYLNSDGVMQTDWLDVSGNWYYLNSDGVMQTGWLDYNENWYYLNSDGSMYAGWLNENGNWYYLSFDGSMFTGWLSENDLWYYLFDNGQMAADIWIDSEYFDRNGVWIVQQILNQVQQTTSQETEQFTSETTETTEALETTESSTEETSSSIEETTIDTEHVTLGYIKERLEILKEKYPDGMYWNHMGYTARQRSTNYYSEMVTSIPCNHTLYGTSYCNSYINYSLAYVIGVQCDGFARKLSDEIFGDSTGKTDYSYRFDAIKVGDYIRYNDSHTVLVIEKDEDSIQVAECNIGGTCMIRWGRRITRSELDRFRSVSCFTRY